MFTLRHSRSVGICLTLVALSATGCGRSGEPRIAVVPVTGKVVFQGQSTPGALVVYHPAQGESATAPPAQATVRDDGTYSLTTYTANDGAQPGEYKVTVEWRRLVTDDGDAKPGPNLLPDKYSQFKSSDLVVHVAEGSDQSHTLAIQ
jgi:hypothetical protein